METRRLLSSYTDGDRTLQLWEAEMEGERAYELVSGGVFLMASYNALSSERMVSRAIERFGHPRSLLIGGLGLGYSAREACLDRELTRIDVVEIDRQIIEWNRELLAPRLGALDDPRLRILEGDFLRYIEAEGPVYDCICMDIDNGPMLLVHPQNEAVYHRPFFERVIERLSPGGIFVIWSCGEAAELLDRMCSLFARCEVEVIEEEHRGRPVPYYLYFGVKGRA